MEPVVSGDFLHELETEVEADLTMVQSSHAVLPASEWTEDPADVEREEIGLRSLLGAVEAMEGDSDTLK
ncbi:MULTISPECIES: hypothetical protein [unclassified Kribbella]|uniref:hypothetical protein n=1 Tax=unclassified Kribbella TaxID=2644121 RepID=UPI00301684FE